MRLSWQCSRLKMKLCINEYNEDFAFFYDLKDRGKLRCRFRWTLLAEISVLDYLTKGNCVKSCSGLRHIAVTKSNRNCTIFRRILLGKLTTFLFLNLELQRPCSKFGFTKCFLQSVDINRLFPILNFQSGFCL